ncbi:MAG TPA: glycosyl hydrolase family 18 protein [Daejeonella sp.]|nr:glycosyl hydrolase family 18 protein [Daejeonella sp.]
MRKFSIILLLMLGFKASITAQDFKVIAYSFGATSPEKIPYEQLTHINYAFALPQSDGNLAPFNSSEKLKSIVANAKKHQVKVFISVGGWGIGDGGGNDYRFEKLASEPASRKRFVQAVSEFIDLYHLDGLDLDWEYPDDSVNTRAGQKEKSSWYFIELMKELRSELNKKNKLLTIAGVGNNETIGSGIPEQTYDYVDWVNIMSYDNPKEKNHSSYQHAVDCLDYWINKRNLPAHKAVLGLPFYGKYPATAYNKILEKDALAADKDSVAGILYNGPNMIKAKTRLALDKGCSGVMFWELSHDVTDPKRSLLNAINEEIGKNKK